MFSIKKNSLLILLLCFSPTEIPNEEALNDTDKEVSSETPMYNRLHR